MLNIHHQKNNKQFFEKIEKQKKLLKYQKSIITYTSNNIKTIK